MIALNLRYQPAAFVVAIVAVLLVRVLVPDHADYLRVGDWSAPATGLGILGVADGDSWTSVGLTFLVIMTVVTTVVVWLQVARGRLSGRALVKALPWALGFSAINALTEELRCENGMPVTFKLKEIGVLRARDMPQVDVKGQSLVALCLLGLLLFNFPLLAVFNVRATVFGIPVLYAYVFLAWAGLIGLMALVIERRA